jgi:hypothetical protein
MIAICAGMVRAGSTVQYQIACHLIEQKYQGTRMGFLDWDCLPEFRREAVDNQWRVLKVHDWHRSLAEIVAEGRGKCFYTYRDIRDVVYSLMHKRGITFDEVARELPFILKNDRLWRRQPFTLVQRYEDAVRDGPSAIVQMASFLGLTVGREESEQIAEAYSLDANRTRTREIAARLREQGYDLDDPANIHQRDKYTELHWNHIRSGHVTSWRDLASPQEIETLKRLCAYWLFENGYERDEQWSAAATA